MPALGRPDVPPERLFVPVQSGQPVGEEGTGSDDPLACGSLQQPQGLVRVVDQLGEVERAVGVPALGGRPEQLGGTRAVLCDAQTHHQHVPIGALPGREAGLGRRTGITHSHGQGRLVEVLQVDPGEQRGGLRRPTIRQRYKLDGHPDRQLGTLRTALHRGPDEGVPRSYPIPGLSCPSALVQLHAGTLCHRLVGQAFWCRLPRVRRSGGWSQA